MSRLNSLKHGLLARALPLRNLPFCLPEEEKDLEKLLGDLSLELHPEGRIQEMLVERIGCIHFQLSRLYRFQAAVTAIAMYKELGTPTVELGDPGTIIRRRAESHKNLSGVLLRCKEELASRDFFSEELMKDIYACLEGGSQYVLERLYEESKRVSVGDDEVVKELRVLELKKKFVDVLSSGVFEGLVHSQNLRQWLNELANARFEQHLLPDEGVLRKILRYESMLDRELHRCLDRLERLQAKRAADPLRGSRVVEGSVRGNGRILR